MNTVLQRALHYVECYHLQFPHSGAGTVAVELALMIASSVESEPLDIDVMNKAIAATLSEDSADYAV
ncbi:MAG: hypothetical protein V3S69_00160 [Dehalococcoidales bacterium]